MNNALVVLFIILLVLCFYISPFSLLQFNRKIIINDLDVNNTQPHSLHGLNQFKPHHSVNCPDGIDAVWLWVNGSDPTFIEQLNKYGNKGTESRYRDYNTLLYSIRSVYTFAPFIKNYYLVTMNQIPSFINTSSLHYNEYTLHLVDHKDIFPDSSVLPVFNSNAIEAMLHNIKNLSTCFLYFNDDMLLGSPLDPEHFIRDDGKYNVYNNNWKAPLTEKIKYNTWHQSVAYTNTLVNKIFHERSSNYKHSYPSHHCYFFNKNILKELENTWANDFKKTISHKFRTSTDVVLSFLYGAYVVESNRGIYVKETNYLYGTFTDKSLKNIGLYNKINKKRPQCICLNDGFQGDNAALKPLVNSLSVFMQSYYPTPSPFEKYALLYSK